MRNLLIVVISSLLLAAACGRAPEQANTANSAPAANTTAAAPVPPANIPPEFQAAANSVPSGNAAKPPTAGGAPPKTFELPGKDGPAPDDSDVKTALGDNLVQTRTFHSNPTIAKIEKTTILAGGNMRSVTKVYLKNGQVKEIDLKDALSAPAVDILKAIH